MGLVYEQRVRIRWSHCDAAGIVYHPQYFVILNNVMEDFLRDCAGESYVQEMKHGTGMPLVGVHCDFCAPSRLGDECTVRMWVEHLGRTSVRFAMTIESNGEERLRGTETAVYVKLTDKAIGKHPLPDAIRENLSRYLADEGTEPLRIRS
jgi:4-hydroxybenzoyl-CoA thioesterase